MSNLSKVNFYSHINGNIGHLLMASGIQQLIRKKCESQITDITFVPQHEPFACFQKEKDLNRLAQEIWNSSEQDIYDASPFLELITKEEREGCDYFFQTGGPLIGFDAVESMQLWKMWYVASQLFFRDSIQSVLFGVGSRIPFEKKDDFELSSSNKRFLKKIASCFKQITVRDELAKDIYEDLGIQTNLIPCNSLLVGEVFETLNLENSFTVDQKAIVINCQRKGANEDWGQEVDESTWFETLRGVVRYFKEQYPIIFVSHSEEDTQYMKQLDGNIPIFSPKNNRDYSKIVEMALVGFTTRIHCAMALASYGVPSYVVGTDSRLGTADLIGLPTDYVKKRDLAFTISKIEDLITMKEPEKRRLLSLRDETKHRYLSLLQEKDQRKEVNV